MGMTFIEKIVKAHTAQEKVRPGEIVDLSADLRIARNNSVINVVKQLQTNHLPVSDPSKTYFNFDFDPSVGDGTYLENIDRCRIFALEQNIKVFENHTGIGSHLLIDMGLAIPGMTMISTDSHFNILGAIGALGLIMGERDVTAAISKGKIWFRIPRSVKIVLNGQLPAQMTAKDIVLNLISIFGSNKLLGFAVELSGTVIDTMSLDARITLASVASELGAVTFLMSPNDEVKNYCRDKSGYVSVWEEADEDANYEDVFNLSVSGFQNMVINSGSSQEAFVIGKMDETEIDTAYIGTCSNGRMEDLRLAASVLKGYRISTGVELRIVPATMEIWKQSVQEGLIEIFREAGALVMNPGCSVCTGCLNGPKGQDLNDKTIITTGNRYSTSDMGRGEVYLASPSVVAASAITGFIASPAQIPERSPIRVSFPEETGQENAAGPPEEAEKKVKPTLLEGKVWYIPYDNIDSDMIYHRKYSGITEMEEIGSRTFSHFQGYEDFAQKVSPGDIIVAGHNFGIGDSRQQTVDCFRALGIQAIVAKSFASFYERNAINAGFPIIVCTVPGELELMTDDQLTIDLLTGKITNVRNNKSVWGEKFSGIQMNIYQRGGLFFL